jgi:hypothetical protein
MPASAVVLAALMSVGCAGDENTIEEGQPIPNTSLLSCGDALKGDMAPPTGSLDGVLTADSSETTFQGSVIWQASCPGAESETRVQIEYAMTELTILEDDAGYPGDRIGSTAVSFGAVLTCVGAAPGVTETEELGAIAVTSVADACAEFEAMPTGMPLYVQIELTGSATTCSNDEFPILFRRKSGVECVEP